MSISWNQFTLAYLNCVSKFAEFTTELASDSFSDLNIPYIDPFKSRELKKKEELKLESVKVRNHDAFKTFCEIMRRKQPFLKKATDDELEGMFMRMTPAERLKYTTDRNNTEPKKRPSDESRAVSSGDAESKPKKAKKEKKDKKEKKLKRNYSFDNFIDDRVIDDGYDDYSSDDVSLVSESANELNDDLSPRSDVVKKEKKKKKKSRETSPAEPAVTTPSKVHFKWA